MNLNVMDKAHVNERKKCVRRCLFSWWNKKYCKWWFSVFSKYICNFMVSYLSLKWTDACSYETFHFKAKHVFYSISMLKNPFLIYFKYHSQNTEYRWRFLAILAWSVTSHFQFKYKRFFKLFLMKMFSRNFSFCIYDCKVKLK
jgi:hypothetical protein